MRIIIHSQKNSVLRRVFCGGLSLIFLLGQIILPGMSSAQLSPASALLPPPGTMVAPTPAFAPALIKGLRLDPTNALHFDFIIDQGVSTFEGDALRDEAQRLIKYFLASLTVPNDELWVNLSPHEQDRIIPESFGVTQMGRDLLAQDYILKQLTASLMYPEEEIGKQFWKKVQKESYEKFGTSEIPVNSFNKVWIVPEKAVVYEQDNMAFVVESRLKVMLEEDYLAMRHATMDEGRRTMDDPSLVTNQIIREIIVPEIEREVNEGANFAQLRQIYHSMILAAWFKRNLHNNILNKIYADQNMVAGVDIEDKDAAKKIYEQYLEAFKKGVYDYIKEDYDPVSKDFIPRKYFSGGFEGPAIDRAMSVVNDDHYAYTLADQLSRSRLVNASIGLKPQGIDQAMSAWADDEYVSAHEQVVAVRDGRYDGVVKEVLSYVRSQQPSGDLRIADFGAGPGAVVEGAKKAIEQDILGSEPHITVFEKDDLMLKTLRAREAIDEVVEADLAHDDLSGYEQKFDIILLMQVLHEVFSATSILYNQPLNIEESKDQVKSVIERVMKTLKPGGLILISDPLEPPGDPDQWIKIRFRSESALKEFRVFQQGYVPIPIDALATTDHLTFEMPLRHFWSYAILVGRPNEDGSGRYIDDPRRWEIERHERHAYFSQEEYREILMQNGASVTVETKPATEAFKKRLEERVEILTEGVTLPYDYNLIVGTKAHVDQAQAPQDYPFRDWGLRNGPLSTGQGLYKNYLTNELTASGLEFHEADLLSNALVRANDGVFEYLVEIGYLDRVSAIKIQAKTEGISLEDLAAKLKEDKTKYEQNQELSTEQRKRALGYLYARIFTYKRYEDFRKNFSKTLTLRAAEKNFHPQWWDRIGSSAFDRLKDVLGESNAKQWIIGHPWDPYQSWLELLKRLGGNYQKLVTELGDYLSKQWIVGHPRHPYRDWRKVKARLAGDYKRLKDELGESIAKYWIVGHPREPYQAWQDVISGMGDDYQKLVDELKEFKAKEWIAHHPRDPYGSWTALLAKLGGDYQKLKDALGEYNAKQWVVGHPQDPYGAFLESHTVGEEVVDAAMLASLLGNTGWMRFLRSGLLMSALTLGSSSDLLGQSATIQNNFVGNHRFLIELRANTDIDIRGAVNELTASLNVALREDQILKLIGSIYEHNPHLAGQSAVKAGQSLDLRPVYNRMLRLHFENVADVVATNDNVIYLANIKDKRLAILSGMSVAGEEIYINLDASLKTIEVRLKQFERSALSDWIRRGFVGNLLKNKNYTELIRYYIGTDQDHELIHRQNKAAFSELFDRESFRELIKGIDLLEGYDEELLMDDLSAYLGSIALNRDPKWPLFQTMIAEQANDPADPVGRHYLNVDRIITHLFLQKSEYAYKQFVLQYLYQQQAQKFGGRLYAIDKSRIDSETNLAFDRREYYKPEKQDYYVGYLLSLPEGTIRKQAQDILKNFYKGKIAPFDPARIPQAVIDYGRQKLLGAGSDQAMIISDGRLANGLKFEIHEESTYVRDRVAQRIVETIEANNLRGENSVIFMFTGRNGRETTNAFVRQVKERELDLQRTHFFYLDEYYMGDGALGRWSDDPRSYAYFASEHLLKALNDDGVTRLGREQVSVMDGSFSDASKETQDYERTLRQILEEKAKSAEGAQAKVDLMVMGVGSTGHLAFLERAVIIDKDFLRAKGKIDNKHKVRDFNQFVISADGTDLREALEYILLERQIMRSRVDYAQELLARLEKRSGKYVDAEQVRQLVRKLKQQSVMIFIENFNQQVYNDTVEQIGIDLKELPFRVEVKDADDFYAHASQPVELAFSTIVDNYADFTSQLQDMTGKAMSIGFKNILDSQAVIVTSAGDKKAADVLGRLSRIEASTYELPLSVVLRHPNAQIVLDQMAASQMGLIAPKASDQAMLHDPLEAVQFEDVSLGRDSFDDLRRNLEFRLPEGSRSQLEYFDERIVPDLKIIFDEDSSFDTYSQQLRELLITHTIDFDMFDWIIYRLAEIQLEDEPVEILDIRDFIEAIKAEKPESTFDIAHYGPSYYDDPLNKRLNKKWYSRTSRRITSVLETWMQTQDWNGKKVLEIAPGWDGALIEWFQERGAQVTVIDRDWRGVRLARQLHSVDAKRADILELPQLNESYDLVVAASVLYYVLQDGSGGFSRDSTVKLLESLDSVIKDQGHFVASFVRTTLSDGSIVDHRVPLTVRFAFRHIGLRELPVNEGFNGEVLFFKRFAHMREHSISDLAMDAADPVLAEKLKHQLEKRGFSETNAFIVQDEIVKSIERILGLFTEPGQRQDEAQQLIKMMMPVKEEEENFSGFFEAQRFIANSIVIMQPPENDPNAETILRSRVSYELWHFYNDTTYLAGAFTALRQLEEGLYTIDSKTQGLFEAVGYLNLADIQGILVDYHMERKREALEAGEESKTNWEAAYDFDLGHLIFLAAREDPKKAYKVLDYMSEGTTLVDAVRAVEQGGDEAMAADATGAAAALNQAPFQVKSTATTTRQGRYDGLIDWLKYNPYLALEAEPSAAVVDVGSSLGLTTIDLADAMGGLNPSLRVYGVDPGLHVGGARRQAPSAHAPIFIKDDHRLSQSPEIKEQIKVIVSANVFSHYNPSEQRTAAAQMADKLAEGGLLILGSGGQLAGHHLTFLVMQKIEGRLIPLELVLKESNIITDKRLDLWANYMPLAESEIFQPLLYDLWIQMTQSIQEFKKRSVRESRETGKSAPLDGDALLEEELKALQLKKVEFTRNGDGTVSIPLRQFSSDKAMASKALPKEQWRPGDIVLLKEKKNEAKIIGINDMNWDGTRRKVIRLDLTYAQGAYKEPQGYVLFDEAEKELKYLRRESASTHRVSHKGVDRAMAGEAVRSEEFKVEFLYGYELPGTPTHFLKRDSVSGLSRETVGPDRQGVFSHFYLTKSRETRQLFNSLFNQQLNEEEFKNIVPLLVMFAEDGHESEPVPVAMAYYDDRRGFNEVTVVSLSTSQMINAWRFSLLFASKKSLLFRTILPSGVVSLEQKTFFINEENATHFEMVDVLTDHYHEQYPRLEGYSDFEITYDAENPPKQDEAMTAPDDSELYAKTGQHYFPQADEIITIGEHRIQVVGMISSTHMGSTFKAKDLDAPGVPLRALKTRLIRLDQEPTFVFQGRGRLSEEAELLAAVADGSTQHHIGRALGYYPASAAAELNAEALLLEWLEGPLLSELIRRPSHESLATISLTERLELAAELADALEFIHQKGVVHRDIKLQNVKLVDGHLTLFDFGLAYREGDKNATGGSPGYAAPEQWNRGVDWDRSVDIFALSRLLAEWFVGEQHLLTETDKLLSGQMPEAPRKQLVSLLNRMRSYDPDKRPSAAFIAQELRRIDQAMTAPQALPEFSGKLSQSPQTGRLFYASQEPLVELLFDLWFVRHGETFGNSAGIYQGSTDWPINQLNDMGYRQAEWAALELYEKFAAKIEAGEEIVILASPLTRAKETADAFIRLVKERSGRTLKVHDEPGAIEINFGAMNSMTRSEAVATGWADVVQQIDKMRNASAKAEGGESFIDLLKRVRQWLEELNGRYAGKTVIVFGHGTFSSAIRALLADPSLVEPEGHINWGAQYLLANGKPVLLSANHDAAMTALRFDQINYTLLDKQKPILVGANFDVVENGKIKDPTKVIKGLEGLEHIDHPMVFVTHNGRPLTKGPQGLELDPIISLIQERMPHKKVRLASGLTGPTVAEEIRNLKSDEILILTNFRLDPRAESADEALRKQLVREIVYGDQNEPLFSMFISNAFASAPRLDGPSPSTSLIDFPELLPSVVGPLMARELEMLAPIRNITKHPFALMTGGSKIGDKIDATLNPLKKMQKGDILIIYGQMAFTYLQARAELRGETIDLGNSLIEWDYIGKAKEILTLAQEKGVRVILPSDHIETDNIKNPSPEKTKLTAGINISKGLVGGDIGIDTIEEIADALLGVRLVFNNGTAGVYQRPELAEGTKMIAKLLALAQAAGVEVIVGGGDAVDALKLAGVDGQIEKQSSGGGSSIQIAGLAEGEEWAPIVALNEAAQRTRQALAGALIDTDLAMTQQLLGVEKKLAEVVRRLKANGNSSDEIEKVVGLLRSKSQLAQPIKEIILEVAGGDTRAAHAIAKNNPNIAVIVTDAYPVDSTYANAKQYRTGSLIAQTEPLPNLALVKIDIADILGALPEDVVDHLLVVSPDIYVEPVFFDAMKEESVLRKFKSVMIKPYSSLSHIATSQPHRVDFERIEGQGFLFNDRLLFKKQGQTIYGVDMIANSYQGRKDDDGIWIARTDAAMSVQSDRFDPDHDPKARSGSAIQYQLIKGYLRALNAVNDLKLKPNVIFYAPISPVRMLDPKFVNMLIGADTVLAIRGEDVIVDINGVRSARYKSIFAAIDDFRNPSADKAATAENVGGIDMNPDLLELEKRGQGIEIQFDPAQLEQMPITGFTPVIYSITPVMNLPLLLGIADDGEGEPLADRQNEGFELSKAVLRE